MTARHTTAPRARRKWVIAGAVVIGLMALFCVVAGIGEHRPGSIPETFAALAISVAIIGGAIFAYCAPSVIAYRRHAPDAALVVCVNLFLGVTGIGWIVALVLAFRDPKPERYYPAHR